MTSICPARAVANGRRAFTLVELIISSTLVLLVLSAVVTVSYAVTEGWQASEKAQVLQVSTYQGSAQVYKLLRSANYVGLATADDQQVLTAGVTSTSYGSHAAVMLWTDDGDGKIQAREVSVIERDPNPNVPTLVLYELPKEANNANTRFLTADMTTSAALNAFKNCPGVGSHVIASGVTSANFRVYYTDDSINRQSVDFQLTFARDKQTRSEFGTVALRSPIKPDDT